jgi:DnaK suppressor protein
VKAQNAKRDEPSANPAETVKPEKAGKKTQVAAKPAEKLAVKSTGKKVEPAAPAKPVSKPKVKSEVVTKKTPVEPVAPVARPVPAATAPKPAASTPQLSPLGVPVRSGRPSSRLAQLTVPSMAQSIASTAAKASFTQMTSVQPIAPALASAVKKDPALANNWKTKPVTDLSDAEVIAMPDSVYMNDTQMAFFRAKLVTLKNDILSSAGETTEHLREDTVVVPDPADRATIEEEHALELRTRDRERKLLKKIEQSINRIDAGDYGYCDETGEPIGVGRLLARPTATLSLEAQQRRELKQKMFGD